MSNKKAVVVDELEGMNKKAMDVNENTKDRELPVEVYSARMKERMNANHYIDSALRSSRTNEVFIFCHYEYVVVTYDPTSPGKGRVVKGPLLLCDGFPTLYDFHQYGVDAAFGCHGVNEAFLFGGPTCIKIEYGPDIRMGNAIGFPDYIEFVFPCLHNIEFDGSIDAAFESTVIDEAYLFQGSNYALLNYTHKTLIRTGLITDEFPCLLNTKFASDIRAAFASHLSNQAYLFKDDNSYVLIHYTPGKPDDSYIISGPAEIVPSNWPSLQGIVPFKKRLFGLVYPKTWTPEWRGVGFDGMPTESLSSLAYVHHNDTDNGLYANELVTPPRICI